MADKSKITGISLKVYPDVYPLLKAVAAYRNQSVMEYVSETMAPIARKEFDSINKKELAKGASKNN